MSSRIDLSSSKTDANITTALLLAAGTGSRLKPLTEFAPKCLTEVCGETILGRLVSNLLEEGFEKLVVVVGHQSDQIRRFLTLNAGDLEVQYVDCPEYANTNNIYSLWMASPHVQGPFVLIESDLIFDSELLGQMRTPNRIAVVSAEDHMHGTTVSFSRLGRIKSFSVGGLGDRRLSHKTVNIYSLSAAVWEEAKLRLDLHISAGRVDDYYEVVFADMANDGSLPFRAVNFDGGFWSEIDTLDDLVATELMMSERRPLGGLV